MVKQLLVDFICSLSFTFTLLYLHFHLHWLFPFTLYPSVTEISCGLNPQGPHFLILLVLWETICRNSVQWNINKSDGISGRFCFLDIDVYLPSGPFFLLYAWKVYMMTGIGVATLLRWKDRNITDILLMESLNFQVNISIFLPLDL